ncbi:MAG: polysaccharide lyase [Chromatiales bacterium]
MFDIKSRLNVTRTLGSTVMLGIMLFLSLPAATYAALPDVIVTSLSYANGVFTSTVKNQGTGASPPGVIIGVRYSVDGVAKTFSDTTIGPLAAGASKTIGTSAAPYTIPYGTHTIMAWVDDINRFAESNETNNKRSQSITINPPPTLSLTANPVQVSAGGAATLSWASQHTTSCTASGGWSGSKGTSGSQTVENINSSQTYNLTCAGTTKTVSATVKVAVISTPPPVLDGSLSGPSNCAEAQATTGVVFCQDFDDSALGDWNVNDLKSDFPGTSGYIAGPTGAPNATPGPGRATIVSGGNAVSGNSLRHRFPANTIGAKSGTLFRAPIGANLNEAYFGYWVRFDPNFPKILGGKLPGLEGGTTDTGKVSPCCGQPMEQGLGFSTRLMFPGSRSFSPYFYWMDNPRCDETGCNGTSNPPSGGPGLGGLYAMIPGKWYFVEEHVKLNSPANAANGLFELWINGKKVWGIANTRIRGPGATFSISHIIFNTYLGGNTSSWESPIETYNFFDVVVVSRNRIGKPAGG